MITENLAKIRATIPDGVTLVAVSKFHPAEMIAEAYQCGQRIFAESRENEFRAKVEQLPQDIEWHFIGHLQTNKVKQVVPYASMIQSIDSERLLDEIEKQMQKVGRTSIDGLLQLHVAQEETKSGFLPDEIMTLLTDNRIAERWPHIRLRGVMGMASFVDDPDQWRKEFRQIKNAVIQVAAQKYLHPATVSIILSTASVFAVIWGCILLGERYTVQNLVGCGIIFAAVVLVQLPSRERQAGVTYRRASGS